MAALERQYRDFEEQRRRDLAQNLQKSFYRDLEDRQKEIANGTLAEDEIDGHDSTQQEHALLMDAVSHYKLSLIIRIKEISEL